MVNKRKMKTTPLSVKIAAALVHSTKCEHTFINGTKYASMIELRV